jgi:hypothetical protein
MTIKTENQACRAWVAYDDDTYDGPGSGIGWGETALEAIADLMERMQDNEQFQINWICDQIRAKCGDRCAEEVLHMSCPLEESVTEYYANCDDDMSLGDVVQSYLDDNPEKQFVMQQEFTNLLRRVPFVPFVIFTRDGESQHVTNVERLVVARYVLGYVDEHGYISLIPYTAIDRVVSTNGEAL